MTDEADAQRLEKARRFRTTFGLCSDDAHLQAMSSQPDSLAWGVPLTPEEEQDIDSRDALESATGVVETYGAANPNHFAGAWIDQAARKVRVRFTAEVERHTVALRELFPFPEQLIVSTVDFSVKELETVDDRINDDLEALIGEGFDIASVGVDARENRVTVGLRRFTTTAADTLRARYGPTVKVFGDDATAARDATGAWCVTT